MNSNAVKCGRQTEQPIRKFNRINPSARRNFVRRCIWGGVLLSASLVLFSAHAQTVPDAVNRSIEQEQLRQQQRDWDFGRQPQRRPDIRLQPETSAPTVPDDTDQPCFAIQSTEIEGLDGFEVVPDNFDRLNGKCVNLSDLNAYLNEMNAFYSDRGYITTRVYLPEQDLSNGILKVLIIPGRIEGFDYESGDDADSRIVGAFPTSEGDIVNLREIEQALENFNSPRSQSGKFKLYPGERQGTSIIRLSAVNERPYGGTLTFNNFGYKNTGRRKTGGNLYYDNLLNINDTIQLNASSTVKGLTSSDTYSRTASGSYFVPFGNWSVSVGAGYSQYGFILPAINEDLPVYGRSHWISADLQRLIWRGEFSKFYAVAGIETSRSRNFLDEFEVVVQRRFSTKSKFGVNGRFNFNNGYHDWSVNAIRELNALGAEPPLDSDIDPEPLLFTASSALQASFAEGLLRLSHQINGQYSEDNLGSSDKFAIGGGYFSIRGFREDSLSGRSGISTRNDLSYRAFQDEDASLDIVLGLDAGYVELSKDDRETYDAPFLAGASAGVRVNFLGIFNLDLVVARALKRPEAFTDSGIIRYAQASFSF
ncbi:ShlB/FhaC/HecB family hemolysin secretion/activation protein [Thalassospira sp. ER-Se-21-Dark]|uniref:ShlB/FhaC/HecB family hemolysin secretion/activation protein n=1 Tax=Thalassospira sp. ER-Se-21-Dark TaxID=2585190 RepID=UPI001B308B3E|nr:ShlB/FhaC/HecB family hemolysin secretion/activation protein [Thalassospira sp. ER-Se-21-Dark]MBP3126097.1 ShlB/FhaC/HecB family hemolysin secretion/activation protein [Thalassospira sp. ER-Se-21-Dark]